MTDLRAIPTDEAVLAAIGARSAGQSRSENFPVAFRLLPKSPRAHLARVYGFARFVDDVGDTAPGNRLRLLDLIDSDVRALSSGQPQLAPVIALRPTVEACRIPIEPLLDLIEANRVDQQRQRYETFDDLLGYCQLSAAPVGRIVLAIAGAATAANIALSDPVCNALQLLEHCQDVGEDARSGRIYLPAEDLRAAGVAEDDLLDTTTNRCLREVIAMQVDRAQRSLHSGEALVRGMSGWARFAVAGFVAGGLTTANALRAADYDVLASEIRPSRIRTAIRAIRLVSWK